MLPKAGILSLLLAGTLLFQAPAFAAWVYHCAPENQGDRQVTLTSDRYPTCDGGGEWIQVSSIFAQPVDQEQIGELISAIAVVMVIAFGIRLARRILNV